MARYAPDPAQRVTVFLGEADFQDTLSGTDCETESECEEFL